MKRYWHTKNSTADTLEHVLLSMSDRYSRDHKNNNWPYDVGWEYQAMGAVGTVKEKSALIRSNTSKISTSITKIKQGIALVVVRKLPIITKPHKS